MSKIKVYVRVRPPLPGEFDIPGCFDCAELEEISGNWIRIKKEGERIRYFARVWGPKSTQEEIFRTIGIPTVKDVFEGYHGCIFVYGQTGTGKTFTLGCLTAGLEGIQPQCIRFIFEKIAKEKEKYEVTVKQHYVQLYRDAVQDLLDITKDNLKIRLDDTIGATIEKVTIREVKTYEESIALVQEGDRNRNVANTKMNSASSRSHACLITEIWRKDKITGIITFGRLYLIDLAGSERASKSGVSDAAFKEMVAINKSLSILGNCIAGLVNGEKVISFRESPLTRMLQHSLTGHGRTSIIVTIRPDSPNMQESLCTLKFGERAQKVEVQMTPAGYSDNVLELEAQLREIQRKNIMLKQRASAYRRWEAEMIAEINTKEAEIEKQEKGFQNTVENLKKEHARELQEMEEQWKKDEANFISTASSELEKLREDNAAIIKEIDEKVAKAEKEFRETFLPAQKRVEEEREKLVLARTQAEKILEDLQEKELSEDPYEKARQLQENYTSTIAELKQKLRGCRETRFGDLKTVDEVEEKLTEYRLTLQYMQERLSRLKRKTENWNEREIKKFLHREYKVPDKNALHQYVEGCREVSMERKREKEEEEEKALALEAMDSANEDSIPPPSDEPPPTDSDVYSSDDSEYTYSTDDEEEDEDDDDDDDDDTMDDSSSEENESEEEEEDEEPNEPIPTEELFDAIQKEQRMIEMLDNFAKYVIKGTVVYILQISNDGKPPLLVRCFMQLTSSFTAIVVSEVSPNGKDAIKNRNLFKIGVKNIVNIRLGQSTPLFVKALEYAPVIPQGTQMPPTSERCSLTSLRVFEWRSMSLLVAEQTSHLESKRETSTLDVVFNTNSDYEAWIVTLHRLTSREPQWSGPMDLSGEMGCEKLSEKEVKLCETKHIKPSALLRVNAELLHNPIKKRRLFVTLFDFRNISNLDLIHAQQVFLFFIEEGYVEQHTVNQICFTQLQNEKKWLKEKSAQVRAIRIRLVNMLRYYKNANFTHIQRFLFSTQGKEEEFLEKLINTLGPEPTEEQLQLSTKKEESGKNTEEMVDEVTDELKENKPTKEELELSEEENRSKTELQQIVQIQKELENTVRRQLQQLQPKKEDNTQKNS
ncbi:putative kinesin [Trypanosoma theileri]|uniref:Putative kinesin n=1 Tax=Trypanosoma theileri TaxID=67003 RepID=A0A1X0P743_9TRYP|nr:putative kinesin [Trypanosoma theileri]ORC92453.1 putative kinesin [Trypanosoma theileri]